MAVFLSLSKSGGICDRDYRVAKYLSHVYQSISVISNFKTWCGEI
ncbi:hypothetical protein [Calothrix sp. UHCC 0171]|nr:hypothetical protein [Calothrix sp. UHCC 0171]MEA5570311.1 hypothetical protein [Calothrix sp. UHCC 0171]